MNKQKINLGDVDLSKSYTFHAWNPHVSEFVFIRDMAAFFQNPDHQQYKILMKAVRQGISVADWKLRNLTFSPSSFSQQTNWIVI